LLEEVAQEAVDLARTLDFSTDEDED